MKLTTREILRMIDLSAVQASDGEDTIRLMAAAARKYRIPIVTTLPAYTALAYDLVCDDPQIGVSGNVGFPSGGHTTSIKVLEAKELVALGCVELDMVMNIGMLVSGRVDQVLTDIQAVIAAANGLPVKVILECHYLSSTQILKACDLCIEAGAAFVKTGTGWAPSGATLENVTLIKGHVGEAIQIKASGGVRGVETLLEMYRRGARRFGIGLRPAMRILEQIANLPGGVVEF